MNNGDGSITVDRFIKIIKENLDENSIKTIFEIGAMDGKDSLLFKEVFPDAEVYTFEGLLDNYENYLKNLKTINGFNLILNNYNGEVIFHKKRINGIHGILDRGEIYGTEKIVYPCKRVDSVCNSLNVEQIDVLKLDVEGSTYEVLEGFGNILQHVKIMHIETEDGELFKNQKLDDCVCEFLQNNNFKCIEKAGTIIQDGKRQFDSVWINERILK